MIYNGEGWTWYDIKGLEKGGIRVFRVQAWGTNWHGELQAVKSHQYLIK